MIPRLSRARALVGLAILMTAVAATAQSYGDHDQILRIPAAGFLAENSVEGWIGPDGYMYGTDGADTRVAAGLSLPDGAVITRICFTTRDITAIPFPFYVLLRADKLVPGGEGPASKTLEQIASNEHGGYGSSCSGDLAITVRDHFNVDDEGPEDAAAYRVSVFIGDPGPDITVAFADVEIAWHRQVSPPPATPSFGDVPPSDGAFAAVEALAASGITSGCGDLSFCPDGTMTRRQMAVFLAKALGLHWSSP